MPLEIKPLNDGGKREEGYMFIRRLCSAYMSGGPGREGGN